MVRHDGHDDDSADSRSSDAPERSAREARMQVDDIAVLNGSNGWIVV